MARTALTQNRNVVFLSSESASSDSSPWMRSGSSAMPHSGQSSGLSCTTSGCIGHVYWIRPGGLDGSAASFRRDNATCGWDPSPSELTYREGCARNAARQCALQKRYVRSSWSRRYRAVLSSTVIPQTGSRSRSFSLCKGALGSEWCTGRSPVTTASGVPATLPRPRHEQTPLSRPRDGCSVTLRYAREVPGSTTLRCRERVCQLSEDASPGPDPLCGPRLLR